MLGIAYLLYKDENRIAGILFFLLNSYFSTLLILIGLITVGLPDRTIHLDQLQSVGQATNKYYPGGYVGFSFILAGLTWKLGLSFFLAQNLYLAEKVSVGMVVLYLTGSKFFPIVLMLD